MCISLPYVVGKCVLHYPILLEHVYCTTLYYLKCVYHYHVLLANVFLLPYVDGNVYITTLYC